MIGGDNSGNIAAVTAGRDVTLNQSMTTPESDLGGLLLPGNAPIPAQYILEPFKVGPIGSETTVDVSTKYKDDFKIYLGGIACVLTNYREVTVIRLNGHDLVKIRRTSEGVSLSATVHREDERMVAKIENNTYKVNPNNYFESPIRKDKSTIAIRDKTGTEVLRASFLNETTFELLGVFVVPGAPTLRVTRDEIRFDKLQVAKSIGVNPDVCFSFDTR